MKSLVTAIVILGLLGGWVSTCFVAVDETEFVIVKRFGRPTKTVIEPGLTVKWPVPIENAVRFDNRLQIFEDPGPDQPVKEYLTRDKKNVEVGTATCWRIIPEPEAVLAFLATVRDRDGAQLRLGDIVKSELNAVLGSCDFESLITTNGARRQWTETFDQVRTACAARARESFGIEIVDLHVQRLSFPAQNRRHVFDRMRAERERIAKQYRSEGEAQAMRIIADAQAEQERILAEARSESARIRGNAEAEATRIYGEAYATDPEFYRFVRTLESYERGIDDDTILVLPAEAPFLRWLIAPDIPVTAPTATDPSSDLKKLTQDDQRPAADNPNPES
jgi:membrane protease subunit HflC